MSTKTTNIELTKPAADENVSRTVINNNYDIIDTEVSKRVKTSSIVNSLTSTAVNVPLSAAQGKILSDKADELTTSVATKADKNNTVLTGSLSLGRKADSSVGTNSIALGEDAEAIGKDAYAEGYKTKASANYTHAEGNLTTAEGNNSHAEGRETVAKGNESHAEGFHTVAQGVGSHAEGGYTDAQGAYSHTEGYHTGTTSSASYSHAEGYETKAEAIYGHTEGAYAKATGSASHAEGRSTTASGQYSHAEGYGSRTSGSSSHAEGENTEASSQYAHAEGYKTKATNITAHAEGNCTIANGLCSHAQNNATTASGANSTAMGTNTVAGGSNSVAAGFATKAGYDNQVAIGVNNQPEASLFVVGNGTSDTNRSNAFSVYQSGMVTASGDIVGNNISLTTLNNTVGGLSQTVTNMGSTITSMGTAIGERATKTYVDNGLASVEGTANELSGQIAQKQDALTDSDKNTIVKNALVSSNRITGLTDTEKDNACDVIGAERAKGEWELILSNTFVFDTASDIVINLGEAKNHVRVFMFCTNDGVSKVENYGLGRIYLNGVDKGNAFELGSFSVANEAKSSYIKYDADDMPLFTTWAGSGGRSPLTVRNGKVAEIARSINFNPTPIDKIVLEKYTGTFYVKVYAK